MAPKDPNADVFVITIRVHRKEVVISGMWEDDEESSDDDSVEIVDAIMDILGEKPSELYYADNFGLEDVASLVAEPLKELGFESITLEDCENAVRNHSGVGFIECVLDSGNMVEDRYAYIKSKRDRK